MPRADIQVPKSSKIRILRIKEDKSKGVVHYVVYWPMLSAPVGNRWPALKTKIQAPWSFFGSKTRAEMGYLERNLETN